MERRILIALLVVAAGYAIIKKHIAYSAAGEITVSSDVLAFVNAGNDILHGKKHLLHRDRRKNFLRLPSFLRVHEYTVDVSFPASIVDIGWYLLNIFLLSMLFNYGYELFTTMPFSSNHSERTMVLRHGKHSLVITLPSYATLRTRTSI